MGAGYTQIPSIKEGNPHKTIAKMNEGEEEETEEEEEEERVEDGEEALTSEEKKEERLKEKLFFLNFF